MKTARRTPPRWRPCREGEDRLVRLDRTQVLPHQGERVVPRDRLVVRATRAEREGLGDPALLVEPVVGLVGQLRDRVRREERPVQQVPGGFVGDRLGTVLAKLRGVAVPRLGVGPRAPLAVEAVGLVELAQAEPGPDHPICSTDLLRATPTPVMPAAERDGSPTSTSSSSKSYRRDRRLMRPSYPMPPTCSSGRLPRRNTSRAGPELRSSRRPPGPRRSPRPGRGRPRTRRTPGPPPRARPRRAPTGRRCRP